MRRYLLQLLILTLVLCALVAGFNRLVDPFGRWELKRFAGLNLYKPRFTDGMQLTKPHRLRDQQPDLLLLGSSRVGEGFSCQLFAETNCYNAALPGSTLYESAYLFRDALRFKPRIYLGLDFETALRGYQQPPGFRPDRFPVTADGSTNWQYPLQALRDAFSLNLALGTTLESVQTWWQQSPQRVRPISRSLDTDGSWRVRERTAAEIAPSQQQAFKLISAYANSIIAKAMAQGDTGIAARLEEYFLQLEALVDQAEAANIELQLFINPSHASFLDILKEKEAQSVLLEWLKGLQRLEHGRKIAPIWLFIDYDRFSTTRGDNKVPNTYFNDPIHFNRALGALMVQRMHGDCDDVGPGYCLGNLDLDWYARRLDQAPGWQP